MKLIIDNILASPRAVLLPIVIWLLQQYMTFQKYGVRIGGDTTRYTSAASRILDGRMPEGKQLSYLGYDLFIAFNEALGGSLFSIVLLQMIIAFFALLALYYFANNVFGKSTAFFAAFLFAVYPEPYYWNIMVLTESLYTSFIIFSLWWISNIKHPWHWLAAGLLVLFTASIRPHGVGLLAAFAIYIVLLLNSAKQYKVIVGLIVLLMLLSPLLWMKVGAMSAHENLVDHYKQGTVIWGHADSGLGVLQNVSNTTRYNDAKHPVTALTWFVIEQPVWFMKLAGKKLYYFASHLRPYFSTAHNLVSMVFLIPSYLFMGLGLAAARAKQQHAKSLLLSIFIMQALIVTVTFADWDARHLLPVISVVFILAAAGFDHVLKRVNTVLSK